MHPDTILPHDNTVTPSKYRSVFATNTFNLILHAENGTLTVVLRLYSTGVRTREIGRFDVQPQPYTCSQAEAFKIGIEKTLKHLNDSYSWNTPVMKQVRRDAQPFLNFCLNQGLDLRLYPNV
jgi:hypothetical protein